MADDEGSPEEAVMKLASAMKDLLDSCAKHGHEADHFIIDEKQWFSLGMDQRTDKQTFGGVPIHVGELRHGTLVSLIPKPYSH